jgi:ribosomal protein S18 acetylase RimI-like enzyme
VSAEGWTSAEVRVAATEERDAVTALIAGFRDFYEETTPTDATIEEMVAQLIGDERTDFLLIGEPAVGLAAMRYRPSVWTGADDAWLEDLFVVESERGNGAGRALVQACIERAAERGCKRVQLDANERNEGAVGLYESLEFRSSAPHRFEGGRNLYFTRWI